MKANMNSIRSNTLSRALGALSLMCVCGLTATSQADAQAPYLQTTTAKNSLGDWTDLSKKDSNPNSLYFVTSNWNPPGNGGVYNNHPIGVWFDSARKDWAIFNQDQTPIPLDAPFNVISVPAHDNAYVHTATAANTTADSTYLNNAYTNFNPNALVWVTPNWNPGGKGGVYNDHNIGVWFNGDYWAIFNRDGSPMPVGASFNVIVAAGSFYPNAYVHTATASNSMGDYTILDDSLINGANGHLLMVTLNDNPDRSFGVFDDHAIGVFYDSSIKRYAIFNQDGSPIPPGAAFNVWVLK